MQDNVAVIRFAEEAKAYQLMSMLDRAGSPAGVEIRSIAVVSRDADGRVLVPEVADPDSGSATATGGLIGLVVGFIGGPLGMLLGGSLGVVVGSVGDVARSDDQDAALLTISRQIRSGETVVVADVGESTPAVLDDLVAPLGGHIARRSSEDVLAEVETVRAAQDAAEEEARRVRSSERRSERKAKWEAFIDRFRSRSDSGASSGT